MKIRTGYKHPVNKRKTLATLMAERLAAEKAKRKTEKKEE